MPTESGPYGFLSEQLSTMDKVGLLRSVPLLSEISDEYLLAIARHGRDYRVDAGEVLIREGDVGNDLVLLLEGNANVQRGTQILNKLQPGDHVGEISLLDGQPRSADVIAETPVRVLTIDHVAFAQILESEPNLTRKIVLGLCRMIRRGIEPKV